MTGSGSVAFTHVGWQGPWGSRQQPPYFRAPFTVITTVWKPERLPHTSLTWQNKPTSNLPAQAEQRQAPRAGTLSAILLSSSQTALGT